MSSNFCLAFFGLRYEVLPAEIEALENRSDFRMEASRKAGLKHYWANFSAPDRYLLFVGAQLAILGPENQSEFSLSSTEILSIIDTTKEKLQRAHLAGEPAIYFQWAQD